MVAIARLPRRDDARQQQTRGEQGREKATHITPPRKNSTSQSVIAMMPLVFHTTVNVPSVTVWAPPK